MLEPLPRARPRTAGKSMKNGSPSAPETNEILEKGSPETMDVRLLKTLPVSVKPDPLVRRLAALLAPGFYLDVGNVCNQFCLYCAVPRDEMYRTTAGDAVVLARNAVESGWETCVLIGGEPTIWPHLIPVLKRVRELGVKRVILTTNGLMLAYPDSLAELEKLGMAVVGLSFDDFDPDNQALLTDRPDNPELIAKAVANLRSSTVETYFYTVVTGVLEGRGEEMGAWAAEEAGRFAGTPSFMFAGLKPVEAARESLERLDITLTETARVIADVIERAGDKAPVAFRDVPLCLLSEHLSHCMDLYHLNASVDLATGKIKPAGFRQDRRLVDACESCRLKRACPGIYEAYLARHGEGEFEPFE